MYLAKVSFSNSNFFFSHCLLCGHKDPILIFLFEKVNEIFFNFFFKMPLDPLRPLTFLSLDGILDDTADI